MRLNRRNAVSSGLLLSGILAFSTLRCSEGKLGTSGDDGGARIDAAKDGALGDSAIAPPGDGSVPVDANIDANTVDPISGIAAVQRIMNGFGFVEGPLWRAATSDLLFNDIPANITKKLVLPATFTDFRTGSQGANGMALDPAKKLVVCEGGGRRVSRENGAGGFDLVIDKWQGTNLNSPNDVIVRSDGTIYFTDPSYGGTKQLAFEGVFRVDPAGNPTLVAMGLTRPNGIALSPDEKTLYVADEPAGKIVKFPVNNDGSTGTVSDFVLTPNPDGITVDDDGNVYSASKNGVDVFRSSGTKIGTIPVPEQPANVAFGGADRKRLFITARTGLYSVQVNVAGPP